MQLDSIHINQLILYVPTELSHSSYLITSVQEFAIKNQIELIYNSSLFSSKGRIEVFGEELVKTTHSYLKVVFVRLDFKDNSSKLLAFDFHDSNTFFSKEGIDKADVYFKRTYTKAEVDLISKHNSKRIYSMGLPFMLRPDKIFHKNEIKKNHLKELVKHYSKLDRLIFKHILNGFSQHKKIWKNFVSTRTLSDFEILIKAKNINSVFYQKRFFPNENSNDTKAVHQQRVDIVRLLKNEFPNNFKGGIKDDQNLPLRFKDCASDIEGSQSQFLNAMQDCGICIYTRGLGNSIGWTLPEFMSQGKAIVAERQSIVFPNPIEHNVHLLYFDTLEELKNHIHYLLDQPDEVIRLSKNARQYYEENISPKIYFENVLKQIHA
ncbi:glycosyltransferase [Psychroflexus tropicus]|uniref:glycosyltransferase n=1 Tax=Psychroflexus tropicus TaxID=197345 RepID=UPI0003790691|nr:hypothetical protein [Psychroflexus tropicus]